MSKLQVQHPGKETRAPVWNSWPRITGCSYCLWGLCPKLPVQDPAPGLHVFLLLFTLRLNYTAGVSSLSDVSPGSEKQVLKYAKTRVPPCTFHFTKFQHTGNMSFLFFSFKKKKKTLPRIFNVEKSLRMNLLCCFVEDQLHWV